MFKIQWVASLTEYDDYSLIEYDDYTSKELQSWSYKILINGYHSFFSEVFTFTLLKLPKISAFKEAYEVFYVSKPKYKI